MIQDSFEAPWIRGFLVREDCLGDRNMEIWLRCSVLFRGKMGELGTSYASFPFTYSVYFWFLWHLKMASPRELAVLKGHGHGFKHFFEQFKSVFVLHV